MGVPDFRAYNDALRDKAELEELTMSDQQTVSGAELAYIGWCRFCLDGDHDACVAMVNLPATGHLCECPWVPWSAEVRQP